MNLLAIDTATATLRLALRFDEDRLVKSSERVERSHGQMLMRKVENLCSSANVAPHQIGGIAVAIGPGSFTGLRIGLAAAKGMAVALNIPIVGVSHFDIARFLLTSAHEMCWVGSLRRGEFFVAPLGDGSDPVKDTVFIPGQEIRARLGNRHGVIFEDDAERFSEEVRHTLNLQAIDYDASVLIDVGGRRLAEGNADPLDTLEPLYLQKSQAEINFEKRRQSI